ncbi:MAG: hypothetical protein WA919_06925 [Coleofasciculaceae cyanobacterium]
MERPDSQKPPIAQTGKTELDPIFKEQVTRLHRLNVYGRWLLVFILWITVGSLSFWGWRYEISLLQEHFTWAALQYGIIYNRLPALGFAICIGMTTSVLVWQSRNILFGMPRQEQKLLEQRARKICQQGASHPLWKWVCKF